MVVPARIIGVGCVMRRQWFGLFLLAVVVPIIATMLA